MANRNVREVSCINALMSHTSEIDMLIEFLNTEKLINDAKAKELRLSQNKAKDIRELLESLRKGDLVSLIEYEWALLPIEYIKITIITNTTTREFMYQSV